jgi:hypothetical protein
MPGSTPKTQDNLSHIGEVPSWRGGEKLPGERALKKINEERSRDVYENKGKMTIFPIKMATFLHKWSDILYPRTRILLKPSVFLSSFESWGMNSSLQNVQTRGPSCNEKGSLFERRHRRLHLRTMPMYPTMYMKTQGLIGNSRDLREIVCR